MTTLRTAAQLAVTMLKTGVPEYDARDVLEVLECALAEPVTVDVESALQAVAEKIGDQCAVWYGIGARDVEEVLREAARYGLVHGALAEPEQEPVGVVTMLVKGGVTWHRWPADMPDGTHLYTSPPQRKPLTEEEIERICQSFLRGYTDQDLARAVEAAHGIK
jgi:hypothetical protein